MFLFIPFWSAHFPPMDRDVLPVSRERENTVRKDLGDELPIVGRQLLPTVGGGVQFKEKGRFSMVKNRKRWPSCTFPPSQGI